MKLLLVLMLFIEIGTCVRTDIMTNGITQCINQAVRLYDNGYYKEASIIIDILQRIDDSNWRIYETRAFILDKTDEERVNEPLTINCLNMAIQLAPKQAVASYYLRGAIELRHCNWENGIKDLSCSIELAPTNVGMFHSYVLRAAAYGSISNYDAGIADAIQAREICSKSALPYVIMASAYNAISNRVEARHNLDIALKMDPSNQEVIKVKSEIVQAELNMAVDSCNAGRNVEALHTLDYIGSIDDSNYLIYEKRAMIMDKMGPAKDAEPLILSNLNTAVRLAPLQAADAYILRAKIAFRKGDLSNSLNDLTRLIEHNPTNQCAYNAYVVRCAVYASQSNYIATIDDANRAKNLCPQEALPYVILANTYNDISNHSEAIRNLDVALKLAPSNELVLKTKHEIMGEGTAPIK